MTIFTQLPSRQSSISEFEASRSDVLAADLEESLLRNPISSAVRGGELVKAEEGTPRGPFGIFGRNEPDSLLLAADDARQRVKDLGVDLAIPDDGIRKRALDILVERKQDEMRRQDLSARAPGGVAFGAARLAVGIGAAAVDPLNIAASFIPVVGQARYARMIANAAGPLGRAGVRAGVGALEGTVGAALVEPIVYRAATQEQADYTLSDSLMNLAVGTVLGGGLHVGGGAIGDAIARRAAGHVPAEPLPRLLDAADVKTREAALRTSLSQALNGRQIDVDPIIATMRVADEPAQPVQSLAASIVPEGTNIRADGAYTPSPAASVEKAIFIAPENASQLEAPARSAWRVQDNGDGTASIAVRKRGQWIIGEDAPRVPFSSAASPGAVSVALRASEQGGFSRIRIGDAPERVARDKQGPIRPGPAQPAKAAAPQVMRLSDPAAVERANVLLRQNTTDPRAVGAARARNAQAEQPTAAPGFAETIGVDEAVEDARRLAETLDAAGMADREIAAADSLIETAASYGRAVVAAANCQLRRGA